MSNTIASRSDALAERGSLTAPALGVENDFFRLYRLS
jgi:hypothetical protein